MDVGMQPARKALPGQSAGRSNSKTRASIPGIPTKGMTIHTLVTSNGSPYLNFQNRVM